MQGVGASPIDVHACEHRLPRVRRAEVVALALGHRLSLRATRTGAPGSSPSAVGWLAVKNSEDFTRLCDYDLNWFDDARRFEVITLPYQEFAGFNASLELFESVGWPQRARARGGARDADRRWAEDHRDVALVTPADPKAARWRRVGAAEGSRGSVRAAAARRCATFAARRVHPPCAAFLHVGRKRSSAD